jgi:hypothetical protein
MKLLKLLNLSLAAAALVVGTGTVARANIVVTNNVTDGTYAFTATDGDNALNGSTVTFKSDAIVSWHLVDSVAEVLYSPSAGSWYTTTLPLTKSNSQIVSSNTYVGNPNEWDFTIQSKNPGTYFYDYFIGNNNEPLGTGALYCGFGDPIGTWGLARSSVPDASGTFQLFAGALTALGTCKAFWRGRAASRR